MAIYIKIYLYKLDFSFSSVNLKLQTSNSKPQTESYHKNANTALLTSVSLYIF